MRSFYPVNSRLPIHFRPANNPPVPTPPSTPPKRPRRWRKLLLRVALLVLFFWLATGALVVYLLPRRFGGPTPEPLPATLPNAEELRLTTSDGLTLGAWYTPGDRDVSVLVLHG